MKSVWSKFYSFDLEMVLHFYFTFKPFPGHTQKKERERERERAQPLKRPPIQPLTPIQPTPGHVELTSPPILHGSPITEPNVDPRWVFLPRLTVLDLQSDAPHLTSLRSTHLRYTHLTSPHQTPPPIHTQVWSTSPQTQICQNPQPILPNPPLGSDLSILYIYLFLYIYIYIYLYNYLLFYLIFLIIHFLFKLCIIHGCLRGSMCRAWYCDFGLCVELCCELGNVGLCVEILELDPWLVLLFSCSRICVCLNLNWRCIRYIGDCK